MAIADPMLAIQWRPNTDSETAGYRVYYGLESGHYEHSVTVGTRNIFLLQNLTVDTTYFFAVTSFNEAGLESEKSEEVEAYIPPDYQMSVQPKLYANYPNPFCQTTHVLYYIPSQQNVRIDVYSIRGEHVVNLVKGSIEPGLHWIQWQGKDASSQSVAAGIYILSLSYGKWHFSKKMILCK